MLRFVQAAASLLGKEDPAPFALVREGGRADLLLVGDHAGNAIPSRLGGLGLAAADRTRHIAWDVGVRSLGERVAAILDATFVHQPFSRLVIDCNRDPRSPQSIVAHCDGSDVPGNVGLDEAAREVRRLAVHAPYHERVATEIESRRLPDRPGPLIVSLHSFVPVLGGRARPWHVGVLHGGGDVRPSLALLGRLRREKDLIAGDNEPYRMDDTDYTVPRHAQAHGLPYLELEFRQDLLADEEGAERWAVRCAAWLEDLMRQS
jgi:predicted N-formylglutamate amidohydrolase